MKIIKSLFSFSITLFIIIFILFLFFLRWNDSPELLKNANSKIIKLENTYTNLIEKNEIKVVSYNINLALGFDANTSHTEKNNYIDRLNKISKILKKIDADIVLLQEVDFDSQKGHNINQAIFLANSLNYEYVAFAPTFRKKVFFKNSEFYGNIFKGLAILSKVPIEKNETIIFDHFKNIPFFLKWLYDPHGAQNILINFFNTKINIINVHLPKWSSLQREKEILDIKYLWIEKSKFPLIFGGDFNSDINRNLNYYNIPRFVKRDDFENKNEKTLHVLKNIGFTEAVKAKLYLKNKSKYFTYPSIAPNEKIDYIFAGNKARIISGYVFFDASTASDHLPIVAEIKINTN